MRTFSMTNSSQPIMPRAAKAIIRTARNRAAFLLACLALLVCIGLGAGLAAQTGQKPASPAPAQKASPVAAPDAKAPAADVLVQLNGALEGLAARVSPAVVQILVTGYGPLRDEEKSQT